MRVCADCDAEFLSGGEKFCQAPAISERRSRYRLACEGLTSTKSRFAFAVLEPTFPDFRLLLAIRAYNDSPFAATWAMFGLSRLAG